MSVLTKNNFIKANGLMSYTDIESADVEVLQQTLTDMGYDEFAQAANGDLLMKKTEVVGSYTYVTSFNCRTEDVSVTVTEVSPNIVFADPDVKAIVANAYGSDGEITEEQAAAVTKFMSGGNTTNNPLYLNTDVDSFDEFQWFTSITTVGNYTFRGCTNMTSITIPANVTSIGSGAFYGCSNMTSITIPANVTSIGDSAFRDCANLTYIVIPSGVTSIIDYAFNGCTSLTSITCEATTPPTLKTYVFDNTNNCPIYVPASALSAYKTSWSTYADRIQAIAEPEN